MKDLQKKRFNDDNRDAVLRFVQAGGDGNDEGIILSEKQNELYKRWDFAAQKIRERKYKREQIANFISGTFKVSRDTAYKDIVNAEYVFAASCPLNKQFLIQQRIEFLESQIRDAYLDKDRLAAAMLEKVLQKYVELYPETKAVRPPQTINFIFGNVTNNLLITNLKAEEAFINADKIIKEMEDKDDY